MIDYLQNCPDKHTEVTVIFLRPFNCPKQSCAIMAKNLSFLNILFSKFYLTIISSSLLELVKLRPINSGIFCVNNVYITK